MVAVVGRADREVPDPDDQALRQPLLPEVDVTLGREPLSLVQFVELWPRPSDQLLAAGAQDVPHLRNNVFLASRHGHPPKFF
ncbi:hypothetical protein D3C86_1911510 [compost metagenome]